MADYGDVVVQVHASGFTGDELTWPSTYQRIGMGVQNPNPEEERSMKLIRTVICVGILMAIPYMGAAVAVYAVDEGKSLYERLGGYDAISAVVGEFANRLFSDQKLERFFGGWSADKQA